MPAAALGRTASKQDRQVVVLDDLAVIASSSVAGLKKYEKGAAAVKSARPTKCTGRVIGRVKKADISGAQAIVASSPGPFLDSSSAKLFAIPFVKT